MAKVELREGMLKDLPEPESLFDLSIPMFL